MKLRQIAATDAKGTKEGNGKVETEGRKNTAREKRGLHGKERETSTYIYIYTKSLRT